LIELRIVSLKITLNFFFHFSSSNAEMIMALSAISREG
jgi:hypothetical protein